jgi:hypothetical protein
MPLHAKARPVRRRQAEKHGCCNRMGEAIAWSCPSHCDPFECPDALIHYSRATGEYGLILHDGGCSTVTIGYCPWCGTKLRTARTALRSHGSTERRTLGTAAKKASQRRATRK